MKQQSDDIFEMVLIGNKKELIFIKKYLYI